MALGPAWGALIKLQIHINALIINLQTGTLAPTTFYLFSSYGLIESTYPIHIKINSALYLLFVCGEWSPSINIKERVKCICIYFDYVMGE